MTSFSQIVFEPGGVALSVFALLTLFGQIYAVIAAFSQKRSIILRLTMVLQFVLGLCWFCLLLDGSFTVDYFDRRRAYLGLTRLIFDAPWIAVAVIELLFAAILCISFMILRRYGRSHLSNGAIKETVDMLPVGICFAKEDGTVVLKNLLADSICRELAGGALTDLDRFWTQIEAAGEKQNQVSIVVLQSGKAVMFQRCDIEVESEQFIQLIACDISEQYRMTVELRDKNQKLLDIQQRMKAFGEMSQRLAMTEEILRARVSIHDEMGHLLLSGKYCLDRPETADRDNLLRLERYTHLLLMNEGEEPDDALPSGIDGAFAAAREMGVKVDLRGNLPQSRAERDILSRAILECAANTAKHGGGDRLSVELTDDRDGLMIVLSGNGTPPDAPITEAGGLSMLRRTVETVSGTMDVRCDPNVTVALRIPKK